MLRVTKYIVRHTNTDPAASISHFTFPEKCRKCGQKTNKDSMRPYKCDNLISCNNDILEQ